jgi:hypothetical protein
MIIEGREADSGEILAIERLWRLVQKWGNEFKPELRVEGSSRLIVCLHRPGRRDGGVTREVSTSRPESSGNAHNRVANILSTRVSASGREVSFDDHGQSV